MFYDIGVTFTTICFYIFRGGNEMKFKDISVHIAFVIS